MSDNEFLTTLKNHLLKAVVTIVIAFVGTLIVMTFTVKGLSQDVGNMQEYKADKEVVDLQFQNVELKVNEVHEDILNLKADFDRGQELIIDYITKE